MNIVINNIKYPYNIGCRIIKLKYKDCPFDEIKDIWDEIQPMTFPEILKLNNIEERRTAISALGIERLIKEVESKLIDKKTLSKKTTWVNEKGKLITKEFIDTYELYKINSNIFDKNSNNRMSFSDFYFVKCKDTSTNREYLMWVQKQLIPDAISSIAWTIQVNTPPENIEKIVRQGDCIMVKVKNPNLTCELRHLTKEEYIEKLTIES